MDLNAGQYIDKRTGTIFIGRDAVFDTMKDLVVDVAGALFISILGYLLLCKRKDSEKRERIDEYYN
jgi:hypothetical protein